MKKHLLIFYFSIYLSVPTALAQCAMCTANAESGIKDGNTQTAGLNKGVLYLLSFPFVLAGGIGALWHLKFRNKQEKV